MVINFASINKEQEKRDILAKRNIQRELVNFAVKQSGHDRMWHMIRKLMLENNLSYVKFIKSNIEIWLKRGILIFDILNEDSISLDGNCPYCGEDYMDNSKLIYIHDGYEHERHVYACSCGRFYSVYWDKDNE